MEGLDNLDWAALPPMALLVIALISVLWFVWRSMQITKDMQHNALQTGSQATIEALKAFRETQAEARLFYTSKLEDMRAGVRLVEDRVRDLEEQVEDKNHRIEDLEREGKRKDARINELEEEIAVLRKRLDEKSKPKPRVSRSKRADATGASAGGPGL